MATSPDNLDAYPIARTGSVVDQVPVIDIGAVIQNASSAEARVAVEAIAAACRIGVFFRL